MGSTIQRFSHLPIEIQLFAENTDGLSIRYNEAIESTKNAPALLVFVHDDVEITDWFWHERLVAALESHHLVGLAGNTNPLPHQTSWAVTDLKGTLSDQQFWSGRVARSNGHWDLFGTPDRTVKLIDGLFMAAYSQTFHDNKIRFDPQFTFHHYDMDISKQFTSKDLSIYVPSISAIHYGQNNIGQAWQESAQRYLSKWSGMNK
ncbi:MAG: glycosyltransferase [Vampirovibrionales bacterium]